MLSFIDTNNLIREFFAHCDTIFDDEIKIKANDQNTYASSSANNEEAEKNKICPFLLVITKFLIGDLIDEIITVNKGKKDLPSTKLRSKPLRERMIKYKHLYDTETFEPINEALISMIPIKLQDDMDFARHILQKTLDELNKTSTFKALENAVVFDIRDQHDEISIVRNYCQNKITLDYLENKLKNITNDGQEKINELNEKLQDLDDSVYLTVIENGMKNRLVQKWEATRKEQTEFLLAKKKEELKKEYMDTVNNTKNELFLYNNITSFLASQIKESEDLTFEWINKYEKDVEELDVEIQITKEHILSTQQKNKTLKELYESRQKEIEICIEDKEQYGRAKKLQEQQLKAAVILQSWWRGTMVRNQLGIFKKKKKGSKKGSKKKK